MCDLAVVSRLATADFVHERRLSVCLVVALAAVLAPLLVLFGLRYGIISTLREDLRRNPTTLELRPLTMGNREPAFFQELRRLRGVGFIIPNTRFLAATMMLHSAARPNALAVETELLPTAPGDPLLRNLFGSGLASDAVVLSRSVAEKLKVGAGYSLNGRVGRVVGDELEWTELVLRVQTVLPVAAFPRDGAFVDLQLLVAIEDYREGRIGNDIASAAKQPPAADHSYASFRLYADTIEDVEGLRDWLARRGIDTDTRLSEIRLIRRLDRSLIVLFVIVAGLGGCGFALSLTISLWGTVERKRYELSVLRLLGLSSRSLFVFPVVHALLTAVAGCALAGVLYAGAAPLINTLFAESLTATQVVCRLPLESFGLACLLTVLVAIAASSAAGVRAGRFSPAEGLRYE